MKFKHVFLAIATLFFYTFNNLSAQEDMKAEKHENPEWLQVVHISFHSGKAQRALEIVDKYFIPAEKKAGTPKPVLELRMNSGEYDYMLVWKLTGGIEDLNWKTHPNDVKWMKALGEIAGGAEKAGALLAEYEACVMNGKTEIARKLH